MFYCNKTSDYDKTSIRLLSLFLDSFNSLKILFFLSVDLSQVIYSYNKKMSRNTWNNPIHILKGII